MNESYCGVENLKCNKSRPWQLYHQGIATEHEDMSCQRGFRIAIFGGVMFTRHGECQAVFRELNEEALKAMAAGHVRRQTSVGSTNHDPKNG